MIKRTLIFTSILFFGTSNACTVLNQPSTCAAVQTKSRVVVFFPVKKQDIWTWGVNSFEKRHEYSWSVELGSCNKGRFESSNIGFGMGIAGIDRKKPTGDSGSLRKLLDNAFRSVYYVNEKNIDKSIISNNLAFDLIDDDYVLLQPKDHVVLNLVHTKKVSHLKMIFSSPAPQDSYRCIVKLEKHDMR
jgi:hypothetical protein